MIATRQVDILGAALLGLVFLLPVGDGPWFSFWHEWTAGVAVLLIVLGAVSRMRFERRTVRVDFLSLPSLAIVLAAVPWLQWLAGIEFYHGDAALVSAYLVAFGLCVAVIQSMALDERVALGDRLAWAMLFAAICSVPLAVLQWVGLLRLELGIGIVAGRPVAHMEQTNLLCSLLIQGLLGAWRLRERGRLGSWPFAIMAFLLLLTMTLTQSRVSWLVVTAASAAFVWRRESLRLHGRELLFLVAALVIGFGALAVPWADFQLGLTGLTLEDRLTGGRRPDVWRLFLDAVAFRPWLGWGPLQNGAAQFAVALRHPALMWSFSSAHDFILDLMIWFGAPIGLVAGGTLIAAVFLGVKRAADAASFTTSLAILALVLHGLVELPLHYLYFLLPLGLMLGVLGPVRSSSARSWRLPTQGSASFAMLAVVPAMFLALLARDYMPLSDNRPVLAYDRVAVHESLSGTPDIPDAFILDQLMQFHVFAAQVPVTGLSRSTIDGLRQPMLRFPFVPSQEHYARILGLNGRSQEALDVLQRSCTFMRPLQCDENRRAWTYWQSNGEPLPDWP